jgi:uncharacterized protein YgbK (DUF1537 family)
MPPQVAIVADDLTGALDAGLQLALRGVETRVSLGLEPQPEAQALVLNADTRGVTERIALSRMTLAARLCAGRVVFKKVDSTLRGHVGPEAVALRNALGLRAALVAPAFVGAGRTVEGGRLLVEGVPVHQTSLARDPAWPAQTDDACALVGRGVAEAVALISLDLVRRGPGALASLAAQRGLYVAESVTPDDLAALARFAVAHVDQVLPCGSAGLAAAWAEALALRGNAAPPWPGAPGPVLVVCGSRNAATQAQLAALRAARQPAWCELDVEAAPAAARELGRQAAAALGQGQHVVLSATGSRMLPGAALRIARSLGQAALAALRPPAAHPAPCAGLVLTGGDTALQVCAGLQITALTILAQVEPGVPGSRAASGAHAGLPIVTKAGGFGSPQALIHALEWINSGASR